MQRLFCHCGYLAEVAKMGIGSIYNAGSTGTSEGPELVFCKLPAKRNGRHPKVFPDLAAGVRRGDLFALAGLSHLLLITVENAKRFVLSEVRSGHVV
jgi:hypothetical protein